MAETDEKITSPLDLAKRLEILARQLREGRFAAGEDSWPVPQQLKSKIKIVEKKGRLQARIKFNWSTVEHYAPTQKAAVRNWENQFKTVKKQLAHSFKALSGAAGRNALPDPSLLKQYLHDSSRFETLSSDQWPEAMAVYRDHVQNMKRAVDDGRLADFQHEVRDLRSAMSVCHRALK